MNRWARRAVRAVLLFLCGCGSTSFTENDQGRSVEVDQGSTFTISLPRIQPGNRQAPEIMGALVRLVERRVDAGSNQEIFQFAAEGAGDADIRIAPSDPSTQEFVIQIRVLRLANPGSAKGSSGKPPGSY